MILFQEDMAMMPNFIPNFSAWFEVKALTNNKLSPSIGRRPHVL